MESDIAATYTLTFDFNYEGSKSKSYKMLEGEQKELEPVGEREGYTFVGWYTQKIPVKKLKGIILCQQKYNIVCSLEDESFNIKV